MLVTGVICLLAGLAVPQTLVTLERSRTRGAARYLASRFALARAQAAAQSRNVALRFQQDARGISFAVFADGNGNGVRRRDIASGRDPLLTSAIRLWEMYPGVEIGLADGSGGPAVRVGSASLLSFSPLGTATPGTVYVRGRDGTQLAVRVTGATGRTRLLRYVPRTGDWLPWR